MSNYYELTIDQGSTFAITVELKDYFTNDPLDLNGYTARSQIRKDYNSTTSNSFTVSVQDASNGNISISMTASNTANLKAGRYVYDVELVETATGKVERIIEGIVTIYPEATK